MDTAGDRRVKHRRDYSARYRITRRRLFRLLRAQKHDSGAGGRWPAGCSVPCRSRNGAVCLFLYVFAVYLIDGSQQVMRRTFGGCTLVLVTWWRDWRPNENVPYETGELPHLLHPLFMDHWILNKGT
jgi:hypothetical protein